MLSKIWSRAKGTPEPFHAMMDQDQYIPPFSLNYNTASKTISQERAAFNLYTTKFLPFLLQRYEDTHPEKGRVRILDIGCGFGPFAYALLPLLRITGDKYHYVGIDIRADAIEWLTATYKSHAQIRFLRHEAERGVDYISSEQRDHHSVTQSDGKEAAYALDGLFSIQWSSSVFTHMTPSACSQALRVIADHSERDALQVNTWLIADELSMYAMATGQADRQLPIDCGDFLTYSETNPLVCTAYKIDVLQSLYRANNLEIVEILHGSWRGYTTNNIHYQDMVISRKKRPESITDCNSS